MKQQLEANTLQSAYADSRSRKKLSAENDLLLNGKQLLHNMLGCLSPENTASCALSGCKGQSVHCSTVPFI